MGLVERSLSLVVTSASVAVLTGSEERVIGRRRSVGAFYFGYAGRDSFE